MKKIAIILSLVLLSCLAFAQSNASLQGRTVLGALPRPNIQPSNSGVVVVTIWVDQYGTVQKAVAGADGTTVTDKELWDSARKAALGARFNMSADSPALQQGTITYSFNTDRDRNPLQLDSLFLRDDLIIAASISKITSDAIEYVYPGEVAVNVVSTEDLLRIRMGSGRVINYGQKSESSIILAEQADVPYPEYYDLKIGDHTMRLVLIKGGTFNMGYDGRHSRRYDSEPVHRVSVTPFYISTDLVNGEILSRVNPRLLGGRSSRPIKVFWPEAEATAKAIAELTGYPFRLPLEAEWEFTAVCNKRGEVFTKEGIDEHCFDYYSSYQEDDSLIPVDPTGPAIGKRHIFRRYSTGNDVYARDFSSIGGFGEAGAYFRIAIKAKDLFPEL